MWKKPGCELNCVQRAGFLSGEGFNIGVDLEWQAGGKWAGISWPFLEITLISRTIGCWVLWNNSVQLLFTWTFTYMNKASGSSFPNSLPNFIIFVATLLSYNSHIVQFGHLNKGYNSVFFMHSENCAVATTVNCRILLSPWEKKKKPPAPIFISSYLRPAHDISISPALNNHKATSCLWIYWLSTFYRNGII